jgi:polyferredoxin/major membrane immunogen (membrane-anchored lipoprotein)
MKKKPSILQITRTTIQLICFLLLPGLFIDSFNGIKTVIEAISGGSGSINTLLPALFPSVLLIISTMLFGRFFCGFMCAFGTLGDAVHFIGSKVFKIKYRMPEEADRKLKWVKYALLVILIITWIAGIGVFSGWSPWDAFGSLLALPPDFAYAFQSLTIGTILLLLIIIGSLFVERFFCRYFCPMGAIFALSSKLRIAKIKKTRTGCGKCMVCTNSCKMGIPLYQSDKVSSRECIACMKCVSACPRKNVKFTVASKDAAPLVASVAAASVLGLYYVGNIGVSAFAASSTQTVISDTVSTSSDTAADTSVAVETQLAASGYADGTYTGSGTGFHNGTTKVSVTISGGKIASIKSVSTQDDDQYYSRAFSTITSNIISSQSSSVSAVSGATFSSRGIMSAVEDALEQAKG